MRRQHARFCKIEWTGLDVHPATQHQCCAMNAIKGPGWAAPAKPAVLPPGAPAPRAAVPVPQEEQAAPNRPQPLGLRQDPPQEPSKDEPLPATLLSGPQLEELGGLRAAQHLSSVFHQWQAQGLPHSQGLSQTVALFLAFSKAEFVRATLKELETLPITLIYPLELQLRVMERAPHFWPAVRLGQVVVNKEALAKGERIQAGRPFRVHYSKTMTLKSFALLTPGQPGYIFEPSATGTYGMQLDAPGTWSFAVRAQVPSGEVLDTFSVVVRPAGGQVAVPDAAETGVSRSHG